MAQIIITYWRDIPSQVVAKKGRTSEKRMLSERFQEAIDMAAMRDGATGTDAYLEDWRRGEPADCGDDLAQAASETVDRLEQEFDKARLKALIDNGGLAAPR